MKRLLATVRGSTFTRQRVLTQSSLNMDRALAWVFFALVFLAPLPFGAVEPWATGTIEVIVFLLFIIALFRAWRSGTAIRLPLATVALLYIILHVVQMIPLPGRIVDMVSPTSHTLFQILRLDEVRGLSETISISPDTTLSALIWFCCCLSAFYLSVMITGSSSDTGPETGGPGTPSGGRFLVGLPARNRAEWATLALCFTLTMAGTFQAAYGLLEHILGWNRIFLYVRRFPMGWVAGTFINTNHCASFLALCLPLILALILLVWRISGGDGDDTCRTPPHRALLPLLIATAVLVTLALVFTHSGGGRVASAASLIFFFLVYRMHRGKRKALNLVLAFLGVATFYFLIIVLLVSPNFTFSTFSENTEWDLLNRYSICIQSLTIVSDFPLFGSGAGTYSQLMLHYFNRHVVHAHNEYLEVLCDLGPLGLLCLLLLVLFFVRRLFSFLRHSPREEPRSRSAQFPKAHILPLGLATALFALALHCVVDFPLRIPAIALTGACLFGVLTGRLSRGSHHS